MVKYYRTVSTRIEEELFNRFAEKCNAWKKKPNTVLKEYIESVAKLEEEKKEEEEKEHERGEEGKREDSGTDGQVRDRFEDID